VNPLELRSKIANLLSRDAAGLAVTLVSPTPGRPVELSVETPDPYGPDGAKRRYRVVIEEL
jgi:hypothetical protein